MVGGGGGQIIVPHHTNVCKFRDSDELYISSQVFNKSLQNLAILLI